MNVNVPSWLTETSLTPYPLTKSFGYDALFTDAEFIQFDNFVPTLKSIVIQDSTITFTITFDLYTRSFSSPVDDISTIGSTLRLAVSDRYLGKLVFGSGLALLVASIGNDKTLTTNIKFLPHVVKSIPSNCGIFAINDQYGDLTFDHDTHISYETGVDPDLHEITFNAIAYAISPNTPYLKTLNSVGPTNNSVFIKSTDLLKVSGQASTVEISLVGSILSNSIIVTSDDNA